MGRLIQTISVPPGSGAYYAIEDMKRLGKNVSQVICDIIARHHELYNTVEFQKKEIQRLAEIISFLKRPAAGGWRVENIVFEDDAE